MDEPESGVEGEQARWRAQRRSQVIDYLDRAQLVRGDLADIPACVVYPYLSLWAVESHRAPGYIGWWVICGDCPTDYVTATADQSPRSALRAIATQWQEAIPYLERGEQHPDFTMGDVQHAPALVRLLKARVDALVSLAEDDELWHTSATSDSTDAP